MDLTSLIKKRLSFLTWLLEENSVKQLIRVVSRDQRSRHTEKRSTSWKRNLTLRSRLWLSRVFDTRQGRQVVGVSAVLSPGHTVLVADTMVHEMPTGPELADISERAAEVARRLGLEPRVALLSYSTFGYPVSERSQNLADAVAILEARGVDFEFDGEMAADVALDRKAMAAYPFCRLSDTANVLVMPARLMVVKAILRLKSLPLPLQAKAVWPRIGLFMPSWQICWQALSMRYR